MVDVFIIVLCILIALCCFAIATLSLVQIRLIKKFLEELDDAS